MTSSEKLKALRKNLGMSQSQFATFSGFNIKNIQAWEQGRFEPNNEAKLIISNLENPNIFNNWNSEHC